MIYIFVFSGRWRAFKLIFLVMTIFWGQRILCQNQKGPVIEVERTEDFKFDKGQIAEEWSKADWIHLSQIRGEESEFYYTKLKVLYSLEGMYFLFVNGDQLISTTFENNFEELWTEDVVEIFLFPEPEDPDPLYFEYELSPNGYELPLIISRKYPTPGKWIPFQYDKVDRKAEHGVIMTYSNNKKNSKDAIKEWTAQIFIPFELMDPLGNIPTDRMRSPIRWEANFYRLDYDSEDVRGWAWSPIKKDFHDYENYGTIVFKQ